MEEESIGIFHTPMYICEGVHPSLVRKQARPLKLHLSGLAFTWLISFALFISSQQEEN